MPRRERGVALLSVLFVLVLLAMISLYMADAEFLALRRASYQLLPTGCATGTSSI